VRFDGYDFVIVGTILLAGGALLFGKAYLMPSFAEEAAETYMGTNPFVLRNNIVTKHEAIAAATWTLLGLAATIIGTVRGARGHSGYLTTAWLDIVVVSAAALVLWRLTLLATDWTSGKEFVPKVAANQREIYARDIFVIFHEGRYREEAATGGRPSEDVVKGRWEAAAHTFDRLAKLLDEPRRGGEDYQAYALRIGRYFPGIRKD
jgi:hypothetical protein